MPRRQKRGAKAPADAEASFCHVGRKLALLREARDYTQSELSRITGVKRASISEYEAGVTTPDASTLERLLSGLRFPWSALDLAGRFLSVLYRDTASAGADAPAEAATFEEAAAEMRNAAERLEAMADEMRRAAPGKEVAAPDIRPRQRAEARALAISVRKLPVREQEERLRGAPEPLRWAVCEALCAESQQAAASEPNRGLSLAKLALSLAELVPDEITRERLRGIAWAHAGNALRAKEDFAAAGKAFDAAERSWKEAPPGYDLLEEGLISALKASLCRAEGRLDEAERLLGRAAEATCGAGLRAQIAISRAKLFEERGELERSVALLEEASAGAIPDDGRLLLCIRHNLADGLSKLGRFPEAEKLLPEVRKLSRSEAGELDQVRLLWVEARVAAGLGRTDEALRKLSKVRAEFASRSMDYDAALASLELSAIYAEGGRADEVKSLARHLAPVFRSEKVHEGPRAALMLFRDAAEKGRATASMATEIGLYLRKARHSPELRFAG